MAPAYATAKHPFIRLNMTFVLALNHLAQVVQLYWCCAVQAKAILGYIIPSN